MLKEVKRESVVKCIKSFCLVTRTTTFQWVSVIEVVAVVRSSNVRSLGISYNSPDVHLSSSLI